jgi:hypothetical protein
VSFFRLNKFKGFGGGGGAPGAPALGRTVLFFAVSTGLLAVSFLCFLKGFIFLKSSPGGGGGDGGPGGGVCAKECEQINNNPIIMGNINRYLSLAL